MENEYKLIDYRLFKPHNSLFKSGRNEKAEFKKLLCNNSENCQAFENGCCIVWSGLYGKGCKYGKKTFESGFTRRASKYGSWINEREKQVKGINQLSNQKGLCVIGEYIYFPYPHWSLDRSISLEDDERSHLFSDGIYMIKKERFNVDFINSIINAKPRALMGGIIDSYQKEQAPKIVHHLRERLPELFNEWIKKYPESYERFKEIDYVGRVAYLNTLNPGCKLKKGQLWDGEKVIIEDYKSSFNPYKGRCYVEITPEDKETFKITDNNQVCDKTIFED